MVIMLKEVKHEKLQKEAPLANWPLVDIRKHSVFFFSIVRKLDNVGLDPKYDLDNEHVTVEDCSFLFGVSKNFKINSPILKVEDMATMEDIYWRVFGTSIVTNNEILVWIVHGFITHSRGHPINWAKVVESIAKKKAHSDGVKVGQLVVVKKEYTMDSLELNGGSLNPSYDQHMPLQFMAIGSKHGVNDVPNDDNIEQMSLPISKCHLKTLGRLLSY
jgi:hypothetical protein